MAFNRQSENRTEGIWLMIVNLSISLAVFFIQALVAISAVLWLRSRYKEREDYNMALKQVRSFTLPMACFCLGAFGTCVGHLYNDKFFVVGLLVSAFLAAFFIIFEMIVRLSRKA